MPVPPVAVANVMVPITAVVVADGDEVVAEGVVVLPEGALTVADGVAELPLTVAPAAVEEVQVVVQPAMLPLASSFINAKSPAATPCPEVTPPMIYPPSDVCCIDPP